MNVINAGQKNFSPSYILFKIQQSSEYILKLEFKPKHAWKCVIFIEKS